MLIQAELDSVEAELELVELQITELLDKQAQLTSQKNALLLQLEEACGTVRPSSSKSLGPEPMMSKQELQQYDGTGSTQPWFHNKLIIEVCPNSCKRCMIGGQFDVGVV
ncbi:hypothetical protein GOODEAATRI_013277 [Goodea atripinnis]|uniref:Uncharacterized protein n=1 Tax=Goodea atripinnis TaxID=208336 RepID=A0ABV0NJW7_9TELE